MGITADKKVVLFVVTLGSFLIPFMSSSINVALPSIGNDLSMDAILLSWVVTSYLLAGTIFFIPFGKIADIYGRKKFFIYGITVYTITSLVLATSGSASTLIAFRVLQGIGGAMIYATGLAILTSVFPAGERGMALGINAASVYLGLSLGPFLGGILTHYFGWRSIFLVVIPLGALIVFLTCWRLKGEWAEASGQKFDYAGSIIFSIALAGVMCGFSLIQESIGKWLTIVGIIAFIVFIKLESKLQYPVLDVNIFKQNKTFAFSSLAALINYSAIFAVGFLLSLYLQYIKGMSPHTAGFVLLSQPVIQALLSPLAGRISDKIQPRIVSSIGMAVTSVGLVMLVIFLNEDMGIALIVGSLVLLGLGFAFFSSPNINAVMSSVDKSFYGVAAAVLATVRQTGMMFSMGIVMFVFSIYLGKVQITPEYYADFIMGEKVAFTIFAILCFSGIFASLARGRVGGKTS